MKKFWIATSIVFLFFLVIFLVFETISPPVLDNPNDLMTASNIGVALVGIGLLVVDVILPVPSSLIMVANGALFGVTLGTILSTVGSIGAAVLGFFIGRLGAPVLARFVRPDQRVRADHLLREWGMLAIIITRPIPLLSETTIVIAGASNMRWKPMLVSTFTGSFPVAILYAITGATAANLDNTLLAFGLVLLLASVFRLIGRRLQSSLGAETDP